MVMDKYEYIINLSFNAIPSEDGKTIYNFFKIK